MIDLLLEMIDLLLLLWYFLLSQPPERLFDHQSLLVQETQYDVSGDGLQFVLTERLEGEAGKPRAIHIVLNWYEEFRDHEQD